MEADNPTRGRGDEPLHHHHQQCGSPSDLSSRKRARKGRAWLAKVSPKSSLLGKLTQGDGGNRRKGKVFGIWEGLEVLPGKVAR